MFDTKRSSLARPEVRFYESRYELKKILNSELKTCLTMRKSDSERYKRVAAVALWRMVRMVTGREDERRLTG